ncbi:hypothetical protein FF38_13050, partial [Lucilia cuprina]
MYMSVVLVRTIAELIDLHSYVCQLVCLSITCLSVCHSIYRSVCLSIYLSVCLSVTPSISLYVTPSVYQSDSPSVYQSVILFFSWSDRQSVGPN